MPPSNSTLISKASISNDGARSNVVHGHGIGGCLGSQRCPCGRRKALNLPPGPRGWPVLGSLGVLAGTAPPHRVLAALAARHGPLMHLCLGSYHTVVASSAETARLVLKTHDLAFAIADRPPTAAGEITSYGYRGIVHTPYGPYWRMARKLCATELFSARRVDCSSASARRR